ncbi:MAG: histidine kinase [Bacteroidia bacterium]
MSKKKLYWICQLVGWLFFVLLQSLFYKLGNILNSTVITSQFLLLIFGIALSHVYRNVIITSNWLTIGTLALVPRVIVASITFAALHEYAQYGVELLLKIAGNKHSEIISIVANIVNLSFVYFFWALIYFLFHFIENYKKAEIENLKWQASINEIELNKLKSQLNPHFIFNAMNSIRALVDENPLKAKKAITQLSHILRNTLQMGKNKVIPFEEEMTVVNDYLALESIRYEERLKVILKIDPMSDLFFVPPLMIQTLVENGIKHGISQLALGGIISITTITSLTFLTISIRNSGQLTDINSNSGDSGFGIKNTLQRLQLLYGNTAALSIKNEQANVVLTELILPKNINGLNKL